MTAPIIHAVIFARATFTQRENRTRRAGAIERQVFNHAEARAATGASNKRVVKTTVAQGVPLSPTIRARRQIRQESGQWFALVATGLDAKLAVSDQRMLRFAPQVDLRATRQFIAQAGQTLLDLLVQAFHFQRDLAAFVAHPASQAHFMCQTQNKGPKTHALQAAGQGDANSSEMIHPAKLVINDRKQQA